MVAQAHIVSNTCGSYASSEQQQYICLGDRSALWGVSCLSLSVHLYVCGYMHVHRCSSLSLYSVTYIYWLVLYCVLCLLLCGGLFICVICAAAVFPTCSQQHVVDVLAVASLSTCSAAAASSIADLFRQDQIH